MVKSESIPSVPTVAGAGLGTENMNRVAHALK
jgi:hypothetical protein